MSEFGVGSAKALHAMIEAKEVGLCGHCRNMWPIRADQKYGGTLLSKEWAKQRAKSIDAERREVRLGAGICRGQRYNVLSVVDREGTWSH